MGAKKTIVILITAFVLTNSFVIIVQAQTTIWSENFDYADGTTEGSGTPPKWTSSPPDGYYDGVEPQPDHFEVRSNQFSACDIDGEGIWTSETIDISSYTNVSITIYCQESGDAEGTDYIKSYYKLNGGAEAQFATNGNLTDDFTNATASQTGLSGSTLVIIIKVRNNANDDFHSFGDILVQGTPNVTFTNGANAALNFQQTSPTPSQDNWPFGQFSFAGAATGATLNSVTVTLGGTYDPGDLDSNPFRLRASNTNDFGTATEIGSDVANPGSGNDITFSSLSDAIPNGTRYYWVTADISGSATDDDNINGTIDASGDLSITNGSLSGSSSYGKLNTGSESALPVILSSFTASYENETVVLQWTTESETGGVGFIIDRRSADIADWQQIASYLTDKNLICLNNPLGNTKYTFTDNNAEPNITYFYRLSDVDIYGNVAVLEIIEVSLTGVIKVSSGFLPEKTELIAAYPNPFNPQTQICYTLAEDAVVYLQVYNVLGQRVRQLLPGVNQSAGSYNIHWNGKNESGEIMSSGSYIVVLKAGDYVRSEKVLLLR